MKFKFYTVGTLLGFVFALLMAYSILGNTLYEMFSVDLNQRYFGGISIIGGVSAGLILASYLDRIRISKTFWFQGLLAPMFIFIFGITIGSAVNGIISGRNLEFFDFGLKPFFWLAAYGVPASLIIGTLYYFMVLKFYKKIL